MEKGQLLLVTAFLLIGQTGFSQTVDSLYEIGTWSGFRDAAISYTFDDGCPNQFSVAIPMFNEFGFPLTLFTATGTSWLPQPNWTVLQNVAAQGHEVASHTVTHPYLNQLTLTEQQYELKSSQDSINAHVTCQKCITLAYPYCVRGNDSLCLEYYIAARACQGNIESKNPRSFLNLSSIICGSEGSVKTGADFNSRANGAANSKGWCVYLIHGIDNASDGWSPISSTELRASLEYLDTNRVKFWVATFVNVVRYIKERSAASVTELSVQENSITVQVTDTLDNEIYDYPITVRRKLPAGWISATVTQGGESVSSAVVTVDGIKYVMFDAIPDSGDVVITKSDQTQIQDYNQIQNSPDIKVQNYPNPFNPSTTIAFTLHKDEMVRIKIYDLLGQEVRTLINEMMQSGKKQIVWDGRDQLGELVPSGVYYYLLEAGSYGNVKKMLVIK